MFVIRLFPRQDQATFLKVPINIVFTTTSFPTQSRWKIILGFLQDPSELHVASSPFSGHLVSLRSVYFSSNLIYKHTSFIFFCQGRVSTFASV